MAKPFPQPWGTSTGRSIQLTQDGRPEVAPFGIQVDWSTVDALGADATFPDGIACKAGEKVLLIGQVLSKITSGPNAGKYGVHDPAATDGRQSVNRDEAVLVNQYVHENEYELALPGGGIIGGKVWKARVRATSGSASKANGPTLATLRTAFPRLILVDL